MLNPTLLLAGAFETALNRYLRLDPDSLARLVPLTGQVIALDIVFSPVPSGELSLYLLPSEQGIQVLDSCPTPPAVRIRGTPLALAAQFGADAGAVAGSGVTLTGEPTVARALQDCLRRVDFDWEEPLSRLVGDSLAHQAGRWVGELRGWGRRALDTLFLNTAEYLQYESRDLPPSGALATFLDGVDTLRADTDRLEARLRRLQQACASPPPAAH
jgi:ubiquinone biosynthesis protein UbiJ